MRRSPQTDNVQRNEGAESQEVVPVSPSDNDQIELQRPAKAHRSPRRKSPTPVDNSTKESADTPLPEISGREKLKRHRVEVAGQVWIPDIWGQEDFLKDWIDCSAFDTSLVPNGIMAARAALIQEGARTASGGCVKS